MVADFLARHADGGWLSPSAAAWLVSSYRIPVAPPAEPIPAGGIELLVAVRQEPVFGPVVVFGPGGRASEVLGGRAARLAPLTDVDAAELIRTSPAAPLLTGQGGASGADTGALANVLLRVSLLADDLPQIADLELNPVIARADGVTAADVRVRLAPAPQKDPFLRQLR